MTFNSFFLFFLFVTNISYSQEIKVEFIKKSSVINEQNNTGGVQSGFVKVKIKKLKQLTSDYYIDVLLEHITTNHSDLILTTSVIKIERDSLNEVDSIQKTIYYQINNDTSDENDEVFQLKIESNKLKSSSIHVVTIKEAKSTKTPLSEDSLLISFEKSDTAISEKYGINGTTHHNLRVKIEKISEQITKDHYFTIKAHPRTTQDKDFNFTDQIIKVSPNNFNDDSIIFREVNFSILEDTLDENDEVLSFIITGENKPLNSNQESIEITIKNGKEDRDYFESSLNDPFRITVGTNFDFQERDASSFYFDATVFKPNLFRLRWPEENVRQKWNKKLYEGTKDWEFNRRNFYLGFYSSLYNNKYSSIDTVNQEQIAYDFVELIDENSVSAIRGKYNRSSITNINNIAIEGGFTLGWVKPLMDPKATFTFVFLFPEFGARRRSFNTNYTYDLIFSDSVIVSSDSVSFIRPSNNRSSIAETALGAGFFLQYKHLDQGELTVKLTTGATWLNSQFYRGTYFSMRLQYVTPKAGINLGSEVRAFTGLANERYIGVYLSKSFTLKKLIDF